MAAKEPANKTNKVNKSNKKSSSKKSTKQKPKTPEIVNELPEYMQDMVEVDEKTGRLLDNPLMPNPVISPTDEMDQKVEVINEIESLSELAKQQLSIRRQKVELEVENKKLDTAVKTINNIEKIIDAVSQADVLDRVTKNIEKPLDMKLMTEAAEKLSNTLKNLMNPNVLDGMGTKKRQKINFMFKSNGSSVQGAIQVDNSNDD